MIKYDELLTEEFLKQKIAVENLSDPQIAKIVGCSVHCVNKRRKELNLQRNSALVDHKNLVGKTIGGIEVLEILSRRRKKSKLYKCRCVFCDGIRTVREQNVNENCKSCGCQRPLKEKRNDWKGFGDIPGRIFSTIKRGAKDRGLLFAITIQFIWNLFIKQDRKCFFTGIALNFSRNSKLNTASLDRIENAKGYIEGNVQWVHKYINVSKLDMDNEEFIVMCNTVARNHPRNDVWNG